MCACDLMTSRRAPAVLAAAQQQRGHGDAAQQRPGIAARQQGLDLRREGFHAAALEHVEHGLEPPGVPRAARMHHALRPFTRHRAQALCARSRAARRPARSLAFCPGGSGCQEVSSSARWLMRCGARAHIRRRRARPSNGRPPPAAPAAPRAAPARPSRPARPACRSAARCTPCEAEKASTCAVHTAWSHIRPGSSSRVGAPPRVQNSSVSTPACAAAS